MSRIAIKDASFPAPFASKLEYNSPVHGNWNIVHTGMQVPESIQIYVCAENCMRGVVLTAAEMNASDRFSYVIVEQKDVLYSNLDDLTIEGVTDVLNKRGDHPKAVLLFTVCLHHFLGSNLKYIYRKLEERFPDICFIRCYMDPIMQKHSLTPDQKLRKAMYDMLPVCEAEEKSVSVFGSDFALNESSDIKRLLKRYGYTMRELPACNTWQELLEMSKGRLFINCYPAGKYGMEAQARRLVASIFIFRVVFLMKRSNGVKAVNRHAWITGADERRAGTTNVRSVRKAYRSKKSDPGDTDCLRLSIPSKTIGTGKAASDTWFPCESSAIWTVSARKRKRSSSGLKSTHRNWN